MVIKPKKYLFVCNANINRSKTGEIVLADMLKERGFSVCKLESTVESDFYVGSAGVRVNECGNQDSVQYTPEMGRLVDIIFSADEVVMTQLISQYAVNLSKLVNLDIPDDYDVDNEVHYRKLVALFKEKLAPYVPTKKEK